ncbi:glycosyltransferase [Tenacibaculum sp.]|uniref:glycosyltransferase n=1 Tax=Tenacibaculum sp. TaxID=1906242 RepID=UPI003D12F7F1
MTILLNASQLKMAGGLNVSLNIIKNFCEILNNNKYIIICPNIEEYRALKYLNLVKIYIPEKYDSFEYKFFLGVWLKKKIEEVNPTVVFNLCNTPLKVKYKQLTMLHWPYAVYPESKVWEMMTLKDKLIRKFKLYKFKKNINQHSVFTVQTDVMKNRLVKLYKLKNVFVVPNSINIEYATNSIDSPSSLLQKDNSYKYFLYPTKYYPHKNIEILIDVAKEIVKNKNKFIIILTLNEKDKRVKKIINEINSLKLSNVIINVGYLNFKEIHSVYNSVDAILMPTILETLGLPYLEAISLKKPLFTSDLDFSRSLCGDYGIFFNPFSYVDIYEKMKLIQNNDVISKKITFAESVMERYTGDWSEVVKLYNTILKTL